MRYSWIFFSLVLEHVLETLKSDKARSCQNCQTKLEIKLLYSLISNNIKVELTDVINYGSTFASCKDVPHTVTNLVFKFVSFFKS